MWEGQGPAVPWLHPGSAQHTTRAAKGQAHSLPTSTPHTAGGSLCLGGFSHVPCGDHEGWSVSRGQRP